MGGIQGLKEGESLDLRPADYFYRLLALEPFAGFLGNENRARNLAILSQLLNTFQNYYHYTVVTFKNREYLRYHLFNSFFRLLHDGGINEYEDLDQPFPKGHVQVMTIHQPRGWSFRSWWSARSTRRSGRPSRWTGTLSPTIAGRPSSRSTGSPFSTACGCTTSRFPGHRRFWF